MMLKMSLQAEEAKNLVTPIHPPPPQNIRHLIKTLKDFLSSTKTGVQSCLPSSMTGTQRAWLPSKKVPVRVL
jgi:hypothetical protein